MRITICAVARARSDPTAEICQNYKNRLQWEVNFQEVEAQKFLKGAKRLSAEAQLLRAAIPKGSMVIALDRKGNTLSSKAFAKRLGSWRNESVKDVAFLIGGADGLHRDLLQNVHFVFSFGDMTWPHLLARAMLMEQLYRAHTILTGHPYHRA